MTQQIKTIAYVVLLGLAVWFGWGFFKNLSAATAAAGSAGSSGGGPGGGRATGGGGGGGRFFKRSGWMGVEDAATGVLVADP